MQKAAWEGSRLLVLALWGRRWENSRAGATFWLLRGELGSSACAPRWNSVAVQGSEGKEGSGMGRW